MAHHFHIPELDLIPLNTENLAVLLKDPVGFLKQHRDTATLKDQVVAVAKQAQTFQEKTGAAEPWIGYLAQEPKTGEIVGTCGYKGAPTAEGIVEIAYFTFPEYEGAGFATGMAQELLATAFLDPAVNSVIAYTTGKRNASANVLEKVGLQCTGQIDHPEDGKVWRWELSR